MCFCKSSRRTNNPALSRGALRFGPRGLADIRDVGLISISSHSVPARSTSAPSVARRPMLPGPYGNLPERAIKVSLHRRTRWVGVRYNISDIEGIQDTHLHDNDTSAVSQ
jgi:hypothetical protein